MPATPRVGGRGGRSWTGPLTLSLLLALGVSSEARGRSKEQVAGEAEFEEEIFVQGTGGTSARSASVAAGVELPLRDTPASVSVVTDTLSGEQDAVTLVDALRNVSGASVHTNLGVHDFFLVRGFDSLSTSLVLTDGVSEPEATFYQLYNVERVEVLKGPGSFLYGGSPMSGTVNLLRRQPRQGTFWSAALVGGSFATTRAKVDVNLAGDETPLRFRLNALWQQSDGFRDDMDSRSRALNPVLEVDLGRRSSLRFNVEAMSNEYAPDAGLPVAGDRSFPVPRTTSYQSPFDFSDQDLTRLRLDLDSTIGTGLTVRNTAYSTDLDWLSAGTLLHGVVPDPITGQLLVLRSLVPLEDDQRFIGNRFEASLARTRHQWLFGLEVSERRDTFTLGVSLLPPVPLVDPEKSQTQPVPTPFDQVGDAKSRILAPYFLDRMELSPRWRMFWGARLDVLDFEDRASGVRADRENLSPMLGLVWEASGEVSAYLNLGRGFAPPSTRVEGNRKPEETDQAELGLKADFYGGKLQASFALYHLDRENIAIVDDNGFSAQTGSQRSRGVELELAGTVTSGLRYQIACAYSDSKLTEFTELVPVLPGSPPLIADYSDHRAPFAPRSIWNFWIAKTWRSGLGVGGGGRYVDSSFIAPDNVFRIDDALTFDATVFWALPRWRVSLSFKNLGDEEFDTRGFGATSVIPASGAAIYAGVEYEG